MPDPAIVRVAGDPEPLTIAVAPEFEHFFKLSPFVMRSAAGYDILLRLVNPDANPARKVSRVHAGHSADGRSFTIDATPAVAPGAPGTDDDLGCEDPTAVVRNGSATIFYSGYGGTKKRSTMLAADGNGIHDLRKAGLAFDEPAFANPKEAALIATLDAYALFFEFAVDGASRIGLARSSTLAGPWALSRSFVGQRVGQFDAWHLSPACAVRRADGTHILFYNGSPKELAWRIGWAHVDADASMLLDRSETPLLGTFDLEPGATDIAFAASCVVASPSEVMLYYSISDRKLYRQRLFVAGAVSESSSSPTQQ